jgi:hypothetical protein
MFAEMPENETELAWFLHFDLLVTSVVQILLELVIIYRLTVIWVVFTSNFKAYVTLFCMYRRNLCMCVCVRACMHGGGRGGGLLCG